ncbi:MAG: hypothetical protein LBL04_01335 [Bacteroidales bacterium]|jgi:hypothetical protein|nr:hypothetical protein [Bacteroidales bacterium]
MRICEMITMQEKMMRIVPVDPVDPDRSADPVRSGVAPAPVRNADLSGCVAADRVNEDSAAVERQLYCRSEHCRICNPANGSLPIPFDPDSGGQLQIAPCPERHYKCRSTGAQRAHGSPFFGWRYGLPFSGGVTGCPKKGDHTGSPLRRKTTAPVSYPQKN